jgi:hypothetical protein
MCLTSRIRNRADWLLDPQFRRDVSRIAALVADRLRLSAVAAVMNRPRPLRPVGSRARMAGAPPPRVWRMFPHDSQTFVNFYEGNGSFDWTATRSVEYFVGSRRGAFSWCAVSPPASLILIGPDHLLFGSALGGSLTAAGMSAPYRGTQHHLVARGAEHRPAALTLNRPSR